MHNLAERWGKPRVTLVWTALVFLVVGARLPGLVGRGPWLDERVSLNEAVGSYHRAPMPGETFTPAEFWAKNTLQNVVVATQSGEGGLGLPYHVLLHFWIGAFGTGEFAVRGLSLLLGLAVVGVTFLLGRELLGTLGGGIAVAFCGFHPVEIQMSQEIRSYALATLLCLLGALLLVELTGDPGVKGPRWRTAALGVCLALGFAAHYAAASAVVGILVFGGWLGFRHVRLRPSLLGAFAVFCGCMLFWLLTLGLDGLRHFAAESAARRAALAAGDPDWAWVHPATPRYLVAGAAGALLTILGSTLQSTVRVIALTPFLALPAYYLFHGGRSSTPEGRSAAGLGASVIAAGIGVALLNAVVNGHDSGLSGRYFAFHIPFAALLFAAAMVHWPATSRHRTQLAAVAGIHVLLIVASLPAVYRQFMRERRPNIYAELAAEIRSRQGDAVLATFPSWIDARTVSLYEGPAVRIPHRVLDRPGDEIILHAAGGRELCRLRIDRARAR